MRVIRNTDAVRTIIATNKFGVLADTGLLYAAADTDDRLHEKAIDVFEILEELNVPVYINVITRMEFADLIFRKQLTIGAIKAYEKMDSDTEKQSFFNFLKSVRDENTAHKKAGQSYKVSEGKLKKLRGYFDDSGPAAWQAFCQLYAGEKLSNEWKILEEEFGLEFIEALEGQTSNVITEPLYWRDMIQVMGQQGMRGPDAMIVNLFLKSRIPLLVTTDNDITSALKDDYFNQNLKSILHLN